MKYFKKLVGEKVYLAPMMMENLEKYTEWLNDFETTDYIGRSASIVTVEGEKKWLERNIETDGMLCIVENESNKLIGNIGLKDIDHLHRTATLGIFIGDRDSRNKGYGTDSIKLLLDYGFNYLNLKNIKLDVFEFNKRAKACYEKCGFKEYGRRRKCYFLNGKYYDRIEMDILSEEFKGDYIKNKNV